MTRNQIHSIFLSAFVLVAALIATRPAAPLQTPFPTTPRSSSCGELISLLRSHPSRHSSAHLFRCPANGVDNLVVGLRVIQL